MIVPHELSEGDSVLVRDGSMWFEKVLIRKVSDLKYFVVTAEQQREIFDFRGREWKLMPGDRRLPRGLKEEDCFLVYIRRRKGNFFTEAELAGFRTEADSLLAALPASSSSSSGLPAAPSAVGKLTHRLRGKTPPALALVPRAGPPPAAHRAEAPSPAKKPPKSRSPSPAASESGGEDTCDTPLAGPSGWFALESRMGVRRGDEVPAPARKLRKGRRGLSEINHGMFVCAVEILRSDQASLVEVKEASGPQGGVKSQSSSDARTLPIMTTASGRHRDFRELSEMCEEEVFDDWPLKGPRTASWCLQFLRKRHSPLDHHMNFKTVARLPSDAWGMAEHEQLLKLIELAGSYDQLDLSNLAWAELCLRRIQTIEWVHHERVRDSEAGSDRLSPEEWSAFSGTTRAGETLMVCPSLLAHVKTEVETDAAIMKSVRKAREERELKRGARPKAKGKAQDDK
jgi:hypothetical protein